MTAVGFLMVTMSVLLLWITAALSKSSAKTGAVETWLLLFGFAGVFCGLISLSFGITLWLWEHMP